MKLKTTTSESISSIQRITQQARILAMNAMIESANAGSAGAGFAAVAGEVKAVADEIEQLAVLLRNRFESSVNELRDAVGKFRAEERSQRLIDMALNMVEIIDRNLYERTCDVRWWATEHALVDCLQEPTPASAAVASERLAVILSSYTVYLDLWLCDLRGNVIANGRPERFAVSGKRVQAANWFEGAMSLSSGTEYAVADIARIQELDGAQAATYAAQIRENGSSDGEVLGVLAIHFDWAPQAEAVVHGARIGSGDRNRALILDADSRVIAASDGVGILKEHFLLESATRACGSYAEQDGRIVAYHRTPGMRLITVWDGLVSLYSGNWIPEFSGRPNQRLQSDISAHDFQPYRNHTSRNRPTS